MKGNGEQRGSFTQLTFLKVSIKCINEWRWHCSTCMGFIYIKCVNTWVADRDVSIQLFLSQNKFWLPQIKILANREYHFHTSSTQPKPKFRICLTLPHCMELIEILVMYGNMRPGIAEALKTESEVGHDWMNVTDSGNKETVFNVEWSRHGR